MSRIRLVWATVIVAVVACAAFLITRSAAIESIAASRRAAWASRPEVENWADPYAGMDWLPSALSAAVIALLVGVLVALGVVFARRLWAIAHGLRRQDR